MTALVEVGSGRQAPVLVALVVGRRVSVSGQDQAPASLARLAPVAVNAFSVRPCRARYQGRPTALGSLASLPKLLYLFSPQPQPASHTHARVHGCARLYYKVDFVDGRWVYHHELYY